jgi:hypothetical protein
MPDATLIARIATGDRLAMHALFAPQDARLSFHPALRRRYGECRRPHQRGLFAVWRRAHKFRARRRIDLVAAIARSHSTGRRRDTALDPKN